MSEPALVGVAHGSRDGRSAATMSRLADLVARLDPAVDVRLSFIDFNAPRLADVLRAAAADGHRDVVVVPLLLSAAYHARVDVPAAVAAVAGRLPQLRIVVADVLGHRPDPLLAAARGRLRDAGIDPADPGCGVVLAAAGSSDAAANARVTALAARLPRATAAFATTGPGIGAAVDRLRRNGVRRVAVLPWFLAPGRLLDRVEHAARAADPAVVVADALGDHPRVGAAVLERYRHAVAAGSAALDLRPAI